MRSIQVMMDPLLPRAQDRDDKEEHATSPQPLEDVMVIETQTGGASLA